MRSSGTPEQIERALREAHTMGLLRQTRLLRAIVLCRAAHHRGLCNKKLGLLGYINGRTRSALYYAEVCAVLFGIMMLVDKVLKGAKPSDIPAEVADGFLLLSI